MHIHHISLCTTDVERVATFYKKYFGAVEYSEYHNPKTGLYTRFLQFDKGAMLEVCSRPAYVRKAADPNSGFGHLAISAGDPENVDFIVQRLTADGYSVLSQPRRDGDGYYQSTVLDPDGNWVEISGGRLPPPQEDTPAFG